MRVRELLVGDEREEIVVDHLTRTQIAMYAGASGDFNPLHTDEVYATQIAGYDTVLAHGQLTMGLTAKLVTRWLDDVEFSAFGVRFRNQVWPGDTLTTRAEVTRTNHEAGRATAELDLVTTNQDGVAVATGYARVHEA